MKISLTVITFFLISCGDPPVSKAHQFQRNLPDTSKSWSGQKTAETFHVTRKFEHEIELFSLIDGPMQTEIRIWNLSASYDPQSLTILQQADSISWLLRRVNFFYKKPDSIVSDLSKKIPAQVIESLRVNRLWDLKSQSDLKNGDSFGCVDGSVKFIEIADFNRYRFSWYNCPFINKDRDSIFFEVLEFTEKIGAL